MKKLLALILALVMVMGLMTVGTNAALVDYDDADDFNYTEAIDVMSAVGVLQGDAESGNFRPDSGLIRSEAAKIVAYLVTNNKTAEGLVGVGKWSDVPTNHWAAGFIDYLSSESVGILAGVGDGKFAPDSPLKAVDFAKMLLVALGYDPQIEGLVGSDYVINVTKLAQDAKLFKGLSEMSVNDNVTREQAAQMAFNTVKAPLVYYPNKGGSISVNGADITLGNSGFEYVTVAIADPNGTAGNISQDKLTNTGEAGVSGTLVEFGERQYASPALVREDSFDGFGRPTNLWTYGKEKIGNYVDPTTKLGEFTKGVNGSDFVDLLGESKIARSIITYEVNGVPNGSITKADLVKSGKSTFEYTGNGVLTEVYERGVYLHIVSTITYFVKANDDYSTKNSAVRVDIYTADQQSTYANRVTTTYTDTGEPSGSVLPLPDGKTYKVNYDISSEDFPEVTTLKQGDGFLVNFCWDDGEDEWAVGNIVTLKPESTLEADVSSYTVGRKSISNPADFFTGSLTSGEKYDFSKAVFLDTLMRGYSSEDSNIDPSYDLYFDQYGYVIAAFQNDTASSYLFLAGLDTTSSAIAATTAKGLAIFPETGTTQTITLNISKTNERIREYTDSDTELVTSAKNGGTKGGVVYKELSADTAHAYNRWFTYTVDGEGSSAVYTLKPVYRTQIVASGSLTGQRNPTNQLGRVDGDEVPRLLISSARTAIVGDLAYEYTKDTAVTDGGSSRTNPSRYFATEGDVGLVSDVDGANDSTAILNDSSVILTVNVGLTSAEGKINAWYDYGVSEVTGVYTGISGLELMEHEKMVPADADGNDGIEDRDDYPTTNPFDAALWTVFDKHNYVKYAVMVGAETGSGASYLYATSGIKKEAKEGKNYLWTFDAIVDGEQKEVTFKGPFFDDFDMTDEYKTTIGSPTAIGNIRLRNGFYKVRFDKDGYIIDMDQVKIDKDDSNKPLNTYYTDELDTAISVDDTAYNVYVKASDGQPVMGSSRVLKVTSANKNGLVIQNGAPIFVIQKQKNNSDTIEVFKTIEEALGEVWGVSENAKDATQVSRRTVLQGFTGVISAALDKSSSTAKWVVIKNIGTKVGDKVTLSPTPEEDEDNPGPNEMDDDYESIAAMIKAIEDEDGTVSESKTQKPSLDDPRLVVTIGETAGTSKPAALPRAAKVEKWGYAADTADIARVSLFKYDRSTGALTLLFDGTNVKRDYAVGYDAETGAYQVAFGDESASGCIKIPSLYFQSGNFKPTDRFVIAFSMKVKAVADLKKDDVEEKTVWFVSDPFTYYPATNSYQGIVPGDGY